MFIGYRVKQIKIEKEFQELATQSTDLSTFIEESSTYLIYKAKHLSIRDLRRKRVQSFQQGNHGKGKTRRLEWFRSR